MSTGRLPPPEPTVELSSNSPVTSLAFEEALYGGELQIFSGHQDGKTTKWNLVTRRPESSNATHTESVIWLKCVAGKLLSQGRDGVIRFWSTTGEPWKNIGEIPCASMIFCNSSVCCINNQHLLTVPSDNVAQVTVHRLEPLLTESSQILPLFSPIHLQPKDKQMYGMCMRIKMESDNSQTPYVFVAYESGILCMWDILKGIILTEVQAHDESIMCMDCWISRDTNAFKCVTGSVNEQLKMWQVEDSKLIHKKTVEIINPGTSDVSVRGDGKIVAVGGWDGMCRIFSLKTLKALAVLKFHKSNVQCVSFASNNILATGSKDCYIALWNIYNP
ncbi:Guanine nucleotide binding protein (G protein), beta polypeptide 1-like [Bulinus truncatus]|nr:Guanine nucleotide binding protein (G protein), beta polypeptide 1-like [Bulinus truncatus]